MPTKYVARIVNLTDKEYRIIKEAAEEQQAPRKTFPPGNLPGD